MDEKNWRAAGAAAGGVAGAMDSGDWRTQFLPDSRQSIINRIIETLKIPPPEYGQEGVEGLEKIAVRLEEKIYSAATSEQDYLRKISLKMLTILTSSRNYYVRSPMPGDAEKVCAGLSSHTTAGNIMHQQATVASAPQLHQALSPQNNLTNLQHNSLSGVSAISSSQLLQQQQIVQLQAHRMSQLHQMTNANDLMMRQQMGMNTGVLQQHQSVGQHAGFHHPQLKSETSPQNNLANLQHHSLSGVSTISNSQLHMINIIQPSSSLDLGQGNSFTLLQQQSQQLIQQNNQLLQLMQQQIVQLQAQRMSQLHQTTDANDLTTRQQMGMNTGVYLQQQSVGQHVGSHHSQLKSELSSAQLHQAISPQWREMGKANGDATLAMKLEPDTSTLEDQVYEGDVFIRTQ